MKNPKRGGLPTLTGLVFEADVVALLPSKRYAIVVRGAIDDSGREYDLELTDQRGLTKSTVRRIMGYSEDQAAAVGS